MTSLKALIALTTVLVLLSTACGGSATSGHDDTGDTPATANTNTAEPEPDQDDAEATDTEGVAFEPAYPDEVSEEGLSETDVAQQETAQGDEHAHEDGTTHSHTEDDEHDDDGESHEH